MKQEDLVHAKTYRDRVSTVTDKGKRNWVYARMPKGKFYNLRQLVSLFYIVIFFALPFIKVNDLPLVQFNIPEGKFIIFSKIFWPQDFYIFAIAMIAFIVFVALFTTIYGRLFCGWVCPQTIFMEMIFRKIEWMIEGSDTKQKTLNQGEWNTNKIVRKAAKHSIFFILSFIIANTFLAYIVGVDELFAFMREPLTEHIALLGGLIVFTVLFYFVYAFVRDLVCTTVCPYGRLQGTLLDKNTMQISYDYKRGEPRGKAKKGAELQLGDCVDCFQCVKVCPTGIDIRNGSQMECIGCTACIDACANMMSSLDRGKSLIGYASENNIEKGEIFKMTSRTKAYSVLLVILIAAMTVLLITRNSVGTYITRVGGQLYQEMPNNQLSNLYNAKIINKTRKDMPVELKLENYAGQVKLIGENKLNLKKESVNTRTFFIIIDKSLLKKHSNDIKIGLYQNGKKIDEVKTKFLAPFS